MDVVDTASQNICVLPPLHNRGDSAGPREIHTNGESKNEFWVERNTAKETKNGNDDVSKICEREKGVFILGIERIEDDYTEKNMINARYGCIENFTTSSRMDGCAKNFVRSLHTSQI